jgi:hypothetical protein
MARLTDRRMICTEDEFKAEVLRSMESAPPVHPVEWAFAEVDRLMEFAFGPEASA